ncbi:hypothetical protein Fmac_020750 [Flemingia macrophylla]|uniref:Uncharacterized protein n=1 Tax=Flemingia macrophylla TaxID=520843 RepID=A0ABD1LUZ2_9FABA
MSSQHPHEHRHRAGISSSSVSDRRCLLRRNAFWQRRAGTLYIARYTIFGNPNEKQQQTAAVPPTASPKRVPVWG